MKPLRSIELFSGAGGLALGLHGAGFRHEALYEWNQAAVETLRFNQAQDHNALDGCEIVRADVRDLDFSKHAGVDLIAGGPPCQPFSMGGKAAGMNDGRDMFPQAVRAVAAIKPRAFLKPADSVFSPSILKRGKRLQMTMDESLFQSFKPWRTLKEAIGDLPRPSTEESKDWLNHRRQDGAKSYPGHTGSPLYRPCKALFGRWDFDEGLGGVGGKFR